MNKPVRYSIIGLSALFAGYVTYLIYTRIHDAMIDAHDVSLDEAKNLIDKV